VTPEAEKTENVKKGKKQRRAERKNKKSGHYYIADLLQGRLRFLMETAI
jgi:hypothetical protein